MKKRYKILITVITFILIAAAAFTIWLLNSYQAVKETSAVMGEEIVEVTDEDWLVFKRDTLITNTNSNKGLIIYPGARVKAEAYAPLAAQIAKADYK